MTITKFILLLGFTAITTVLSFCTPKRIVRLVGNQNVYLEKSGRYCNLLYKNKNNKYVLVADSITQVIVYDSVFAYSRVKLSTYPAMTIVKVGQEENFLKTHVDGLNFTEVFATFFSFPPSASVQHAGALYGFMQHQEVKIDEKDIISL